MKQIQLSEEYSFASFDDGTSGIRNKRGDLFLMDNAVTAALTRYLVADVLKELEGEVSSRKTAYASENKYGDVNEEEFQYNRGVVDGYEHALSLIRAKLKGGEDGKVQD